MRRISVAATAPWCCGCGWRAPPSRWRAPSSSSTGPPTMTPTGSPGRPPAASCSPRCIPTIVRVPR
ncbi:MAG: hypothetical protein GEV09_11470 [Pseudonocardiaceae bacterium]|nr:hypothetical protein [Pseudonocardiaceae bacterium]